MIKFDNIRIYKDSKLVLELKLSNSSNNYIDFIAYSDTGIAQILNKYVSLGESEKEYKVLYARVRGKNYKKYKKTNQVK